MSKKRSFSRIDGHDCSCSMVGLSICLLNTGVENGLYKGVTEFPLIPVHKYDQKQGQLVL